MERRRQRQRNRRTALSDQQRRIERERERIRQRSRRAQLSESMERERNREIERLRLRREEMEEEQRDRERDRLRRRRNEMKEDRNRERERMRRRREEMDEEERNRESHRRRTARISTHTVRFYLGPMTASCGHCQALQFPTEALNCCHTGKVELPVLADYPPQLKTLFTGSSAEARNFRENIRKDKFLLLRFIWSSNCAGQLFTEHAYMVYTLTMCMLFHDIVGSWMRPILFQNPQTDLPLYKHTPPS